MNDLKKEGKLSFKNKGFILVCLTLLLLSVALFRIKFSELRSELSATLFIAVLVVMGITVFRRRK